MCVPISKLPQVLIETKNDLDTSTFTGKSHLSIYLSVHPSTFLSSFFVAPIIGHVGDGNFHCMLLVDTDNKEELKTAKELAKKMAE